MRKGREKVRQIRKSRRDREGRPMIIKIVIDLKWIIRVMRCKQYQKNIKKEM